MKKILTLLAFIISIYSAQAQKDTTLKEYTGSYKFPEGSFITSAEISLKNDTLMVSSSQGGSPLERKAKDTFALTNYEGGMLYFFRNNGGRVAKVKVVVGDVLLEGTKDGVTAWLNRNYFDKSKALHLIASAN